MDLKGLKFQITGTLAMIITIAMLLLSIVWVVLLQRQVVRAEIDRIRSLLEYSANILAGVHGQAEYMERKTDVEHLMAAGNIKCYFWQIAGESIAGEKSKFCQSGDEVVRASKAAAKTGTARNFSGSSWAVISFGHSLMTMGKSFSVSPVEIGGGVIVIQLSLEELYVKLRRSIKPIMVYIVLNIIIFSSIGLFRMVRLVVRPIDRLVDIAQKFDSVGDLRFLPGKSRSEFSNLALSLNEMISRIRLDNERLKNTVSQLEAANFSLEKNKNEMIRTEKLASVGRLSAGLAHEIGNPLSIIQGYVDMLGKGELEEEEKKQYSERASSELQRIDQLIRQLLDISRKVEKEKSIFCIQELLQEILELFSLQKKGLKIEIVSDFVATNDLVAVNKNQLRQVILNCLMNATDAIKEINSDRTGIIVVSCENMVDEEQDHIQIKIIDNGPGVKKEHLENIFDPFFTTKEPGRGTGLGLYVSHTIVDSMQGSIRFNNIEPHGAEVVIQLPCVNVF